MSAQGFQLHPQEHLYHNIIGATRSDTPDQYVAKLYRDTQQRLLHNEISVLLALRPCPGVISMYAAVQHEQQTALILERMDGDVLGLLDEPYYTYQLALDIFAQACQAVQFCHRNKVAHLDIKPENLLFRVSEQSPSGFEIKLSDFGASAQGVSRVSGFYGTLQYGAPEAVYHLTKKTTLTYDAKKADIWSLGILLHVLLTKAWPFSQENGAPIMEQILRNQIEVSSYLPPQYRRIVKALLAPNPSDRPSVDWVLSELKKRTMSCPPLFFTKPRRLIRQLTKRVNL